DDPSGVDRRAGRLVGHLPPVPVAAAPDRVVGVAALELDPDVGLLRRNGEEADPRPGERRTGHRPVHVALAQHGRHADLGPALAERIDVVHDLATVLAEEQSPGGGFRLHAIRPPDLRRRPASWSHYWDEGPGAFAREGEALLVLPLADLVCHTPDVVEAI